MYLVQIWVERDRYYRDVRVWMDRAGRIYADEASLKLPATHFPTLREAVEARDALIGAGLGRFCVFDVHTGERAVGGPPRA